MTIKDMIKQSFDLWCRYNWLRQMDKECALRDRYLRMSTHHKQIADELWKKYREMYCEQGREK